jgi:hypothetical protein
LSVDVELWTRETGELAPLLPRAQDWESFDGEFQFDGDGWLVSVFVPEPADAGEVPAELAALVEGLAYRVELAVEPSGAPAEAWAFLQQVMTSIGRGLRGAGLDPETGTPTSWAE